MDLPSATRRLQANSSGVIAIANTVFGSHETKILIGTWFHVVMEISSKYKRILLRNDDINNRGSLKQIVIEKVSVQANIDFS